MPYGKPTCSNIEVAPSSLFTKFDDLRCPGYRLKIWLGLRFVGDKRSSPFASDPRYHGNGRRSNEICHMSANIITVAQMDNERRSSNS